MNYYNESYSLIGSQWYIRSILTESNIRTELGHHHKMAATSVNWEDEYNIWFCESDSLLEDLAVSALPSATGLIITIESCTYKISKPDRTIFLLPQAINQLFLRLDGRG